MAITKLSDIINPEVMGDMINAKIPAMLRFTPFAHVDNSLEGVPGDTKTVPSWNFVGAAEDVAPGEEIVPKKLTASSTKFTVKKAMQSVSIEQEAINSGLGKPVDVAESQLAQALAVKVDDDVLATALTTKQVLDEKKNVISYNGICNAIDLFDEEDTTDKVLFINPKQATTLRKLPDFIDKSKYGNDVMMTGEIGMIGSARVVRSKKVVKVQYAKDNSAGTITIVAKSVSEDGTNKHMETIQPFCDEALTVGDKVKPITASEQYYRCPIIKTEPANEETEFAEAELPALTIYLKKKAQVDHEWFPKKQVHDITAAEYYGVALTNESKVVVAKFKA